MLLHEFRDGFAEPAAISVDEKEVPHFHLIKWVFAPSIVRKGYTF
jgi:hypothetical protein